MGIAGRRMTSLVASGGLLASLLTGVVLVAAPVAVANTTDGETGCQEVYDSAVVGNNPIMFQRIINHIPQGVAVSTLKKGSADEAPEIVTQPKPVWLGQKTPFMDGQDTLDYKRWNRRHGNEGWPADNWWDSQFQRHTVGCFVNYPFLIGPGENKPRLIDYDGRLYGRNDSWRGKTTWWGIPKRYEQDYVGGWSSWTCRGDAKVDDKVSPARWRTDSVYWAKVSIGSGFFGDNGRDRLNRDAGRAPACENSAFSDMEVKPYFRQTFRGHLPDTARTDNRCEVASAGDIAGCWQRIYTGPWNRSWRTETNVFAASMLANLRSYAQINVPSEYREFGGASRLRLAWAISDVEITPGVWPDGFDPSKAVKPKFNRATKQTEVSEYTVPGSIQGDGVRDKPFKFGGWLNTERGEKTMKLRLTATTDGTFPWPTCQEDQETCREGDPMFRPQIELIFRYELESFDKLGNSCTTADYLKYDSNYFTRNRACIIGMVPTLFQVSDNSDQNNRFEPKRDEKGNAISTIAAVKQVPIGSQDWVTTDLKVQVSDPIRESEGTSTVGANVRWDINLTGVLDLVR